MANQKTPTKRPPAGNKPNKTRRWTVSSLMRIRRRTNSYQSSSTLKLFRCWSQMPVNSAALSLRCLAVLPNITARSAESPSVTPVPNLKGVCPSSKRLSSVSVTSVTACYQITIFRGCTCGKSKIKSSNWKKFRNGLSSLRRKFLNELISYLGWR